MYTHMYRITNLQYYRSHASLLISHTQLIPCSTDIGGDQVWSVGRWVKNMMPFISCGISPKWSWHKLTPEFGY